MNRYDAMRLFVRAAETANFTQAADSLGVPKASVSNAVKQLETMLGVRLFTRTTRRVALTQEGQAVQGIAEMHQGLTAYRATGAKHQLTYLLALLAEGYGRGGQQEDGLTVLDEALALVDKKGERFYEAELHRLKGALLLQQSSSNQTEAEACFHQAIRIAQSQQVKSLALRAATSLARLWQQQGKRQEAHNLLTPVYGWFTEGFDTADLQDAKALLNELGA